MKIVLALFLAGVSGLRADAPILSVNIVPQNRTLHGSQSAQQFVVMAKYQDGTERDITDKAEWTLTDPAAGQITQSGKFTPARNGTLTLSARVSGKVSQAHITVEGIDQQRTFAFGRDIGSILTRKGCNNSTCHGGVKGRGGFKLSAAALHPADDY